MTALAHDTINDVDVALEHARGNLPGWAYAVLKRAWDASKHPRDERGRFTSGPGMASAADVHEVHGGGSSAKPTHSGAVAQPPAHKPKEPVDEFHSAFPQAPAARAGAGGNEFRQAFPSAPRRQRTVERHPGGLGLHKADDAGYTREYLEEALAAAKKHLPGWAAALIHQMALPRAGGRASAAARAKPPQLQQLDNASEPTVLKFDKLADMLAWYAENGGETAAGEVMLQARRRMDMFGGENVIFATSAGQATLTKAAYGELQHLVPSSVSKPRPLVAFVGALPSPTDAARGEPFTGLDGATLVERYLTPLGLRKQDVLLTNVVPMRGGADAAHVFDGWIQGELNRYRPRIVVALGRVAKSALGDMATHFMPHPHAVRGSADYEEVERKVAQVRRAMVRAQKFTRDVGICKANGAKQIVYGIVLDPYQIDSQGDWIPAKEIEQTAHDYMQSSRMVGLQHAEKADASVVESTVVHYPSQADYEAAMDNRPHKAYRIPYGDQFVHSGAWILGTKVHDPTVWARVEKGDIGAYSIGGSGVRTEITPQHMPSVQFVELRGEMTPGEPPPVIKAEQPRDDHGRFAGNGGGAGGGIGQTSSGKTIHDAGHESYHDIVTGSRSDKRRRAAMAVSHAGHTANDHNEAAAAHEAMAHAARAQLAMTPLVTDHTIRENGTMATNPVHTAIERQARRHETIAAFHRDAARRAK